MAGCVKEIFLGEGFGDVALKVNGAMIEVRANGSVAAHTSGDVDAYTDGAVHVHPAANDRVPSTSEPKPGDRMRDGTIYAGISPDTGKQMFTTPADAPLTYTFNEARKYAAKLDANGQQDWRVPTKAELNVLFQNKAAIGGFDVSGSGPAGWYWSSTERNTYFFAWDQRFSDGYQGWNFKFNGEALRLVR